MNHLVKQWRHLRTAGRVHDIVDDLLDQGADLNGTFTILRNFDGYIPSENPRVHGLYSAIDEALRRVDRGVEVEVYTANGGLVWSSHGSSAPRQAANTSIYLHDLKEGDWVVVRHPELDQAVRAEVVGITPLLDRVMIRPEGTDLITQAPMDLLERTG